MLERIQNKLNRMRLWVGLFISGMVLTVIGILVHSEVAFGSGIGLVFVNGSIILWELI